MTCSIERYQNTILKPWEQQQNAVDITLHKIFNEAGFAYSQCTPWVKKDTKLLPTTYQILTDSHFFRFFTASRLSGKFATHSRLNIPPHHKYVATLPREIWMSENWQQSEICIAINEKSQGSIAKHLSYDKLLH